MIRVIRDNELPLDFSGVLLGSAQSDIKKLRQKFSNSHRSFFELTLYRTDGGKYVCQRFESDIYTVKPDVFTGQVCDTKEDVIKFFGHDSLAKELYENCGIYAAVVVE